MRILKYLIYLTAMAVLFPGASCETPPLHLRIDSPTEPETLYCDNAIPGVYGENMVVQVVDVSNPTTIQLNWSCTNGGILQDATTYPNSNGYSVNYLTIPSIPEGYEGGIEYYVTASATIEGEYEFVRFHKIVVWKSMHLEYDYMEDETENDDVFQRDEWANTPVKDKLDNAFNEAYTKVDIYPVSDRIPVQTIDINFDWDNLTRWFYDPGHYFRGTYDESESGVNMYLASIKDVSHRPSGDEKVAGITVYWGPDGDSYVFYDFIFMQLATDHPSWPTNSNWFYYCAEKTMIHELGHQRGHLRDEGIVSNTNDCVMHQGYLVDGNGRLVIGDWLWRFCYNCRYQLSETTW